MTLRKGKFGHFYGCTGYPSCSNVVNADSKGNVTKKETPKDTGKTCPKCGKPMVKRKGAKSEFYGCSGYPTCTHMEFI